MKNGKKINLMHITHDVDLGGLQQVIYNICRTIDTDAFNVSVLCLRDLGCFQDDIEALGIPVKLIEQEESSDYFAFRKVAKILRDDAIDVIHTHNTQPFFDGTIAAILARVKTVVHTDHARAFPDKLRYMFAEWLMSHYAYKVVGCSAHTSQNLINYEKISPRKIVTIPNGIDGSRFQLDINRDELRAEFGIAPDKVIIGLAVRLSDQKGIRYLLAAMPEILREIPALTLLIVGDGDLRGDLEAQTQELGLQDDVVFAGARMDIPAILKLLDLYVLPSKWEGLPMVLLEAMAAGCPIVATDVGGNSTAIESGRNGILVPSENPEALAEGVIRALQTPGLTDSFVAEATRTFNEKFTAQAMTARYEQLYLRKTEPQ